MNPSATPIGTLMNRTHRQDSSVTRIPPRIAPVAPPAPATELRTLERRHDDRERRRRQDRAAKPLDGSRCGQPGIRRREATGEAGGREDRETDEEHALLSEEVSGAAAEEQEAGEGEHVGIHDPLQPRRRVVQVASDRGERDVDDRDVEHDHELGDARDRQDQAGVGAAARRKIHRATITVTCHSAAWPAHRPRELAAPNSGRVVNC
jgi:hypothetical protein